MGVVEHSLGVFSDLVAEKRIGVVLNRRDGIEGTSADAAAAALALIKVDHGLVVDISDGIGTAFLGTAAAATALGGIDFRLAVAMLIHLAGAGTAAHADILHGSAEASFFVAFEVSERDEGIGIHDSTTNVGIFDVFAAMDRDIDFVSSFEPVTNDDMASSGSFIEAIHLSAGKVIERILPVARIKSVAIGQKGLAAGFLHEISNRLRVVRAKERKVAIFPKVHLDRDEFTFEIDIFEAAFNQKPLELVSERFSDRNAEISEIDVASHWLLSPFKAYR